MGLRLDSPYCLNFFHHLDKFPGPAHCAVPQTVVLACVRNQAQQGQPGAALSLEALFVSWQPQKHMQPPSNIILGLYKPPGCA